MEGKLDDARHRLARNIATHRAEPGVLRCPVAADSDAGEPGAPNENVDNDDH